MVTDFNEKIIWITGASSGIGEALARELAQRGALLILSARRAQRLEGLAAALPTDALVLPLDVADPAAIAAAVAQALAWRGHVDMLINNAGISQRALVADTEMATVRKVMEVNFFGLVDLTGQLLPSMLARGSGHIVTISSVAGYVATPLRSIYAASKHAVRGYSDALRAEVASQGVDVTVICPGYIHTEISRSALTGDGSQQGTDDAVVTSAMPADVAARKMASALARRRREFYVGGWEIAGVYLQRLFPGLIARIVPRMAPK